MKFNSQKHYFAVKSENMKKLKQYYPFLDKSSGIYVFFRNEKRNDGAEIKYAYIGKATSLEDRILSHILSVRQHIDKSIRLRKMVSDGGEWDVFIECKCKTEELDEMEAKTVAKYQDLGWQLPYNKESGGTIGKKRLIDSERGGYLKGKNFGYDKAFAELAEFFTLTPKENAYYRGKLKAIPTKLLERFNAEK